MTTQFRVLALGAVSLLALSRAAWGADISGTALPTGGQVVAGSASISTNGAAMTVTQSSDRGIINWQGFDVGSQASVTFQQPSSSSVTLNRVVGGAGSVINGQVNANGKVYITNPNGVLFGPTAQVSVGGLVAAAADMADSDFLAGTDKFTNVRGSVENQGTITAANGGQVALIGTSVSNQGTIRSPSGDVVLAAGSGVVLNAGANGHLKIQVDGATTQTLVQNGGMISADGGQVVMTAEAASAAVSSVVANTGTVEAKTIGGTSGTIMLLADMDGGEVKVGGSLDASAPTGGNGGFIETSAAKVSLGDDLKISTKASNGTTGSWLIDPYDIVISSAGSTNVSVNTTSDYIVTPTGSSSVINNSTLSTYLGMNNVTIQTGSSGAATGSIYVVAPVLWSSATTLTLLADSTTGAIQIDSAITASNSGSKLVLSAGSGGIGQTAPITVGTLTATAANGGSVSLTSNSNVIATLAASSAAGSFALTSHTALTVSGAITSNGSTSITTTSGNALTINAAQADNHASSVLTLAAGGQLTINADISQSGTGASLVLSSGTGYALGNGARITLADTGAALSIDGHAYTLIRDVTALQAMLTSGYYALATDIDAKATATWNSGSGFAPIGVYGGGEFTGTLAGLGHAVDGLTINRSGGAVGLFGGTSGASLRDLTLSNVSITGGARVGALAGVADSSTSMTNIHVTGTVSGAQEVGGIAGWLGDSFLSKSSSAANVTATANSAGGLVGRVYYASTISDSYAVGAVSAASEAGGLVGDVFNTSNLTISNSYASGLVSATSNANGLIGLANVSDVALSNVYWDTTTTGQSSNATGGTGIANSSAFTQSTYTGFDFTNEWVMIAGQTRPMLRNEQSTVIYTPHALQLMSQNLAGTYQLGTDLSMAATASNSGEVWNAGGFSPIGDAMTYFTGSFDGQSHTITNLTINRSSVLGVGLFAFTQNATISNVGLSGGTVTGKSYVGPLIGYMTGGSVTSAWSSATVSSTDTTGLDIGGLVGANYSGTISRSYATGNVTGAGYQIGGLVGYNVDGGVISQSFASGNVSGTNATGGGGYIGGLVGANGWNTSPGSAGGTISQSFATGTVTGAYGPVGGLVGHNAGSIVDSYAQGAVTNSSNTQTGGLVGQNYSSGTITTSYATGYTHNSGGSVVGGLVGSNANTASAITSSYWNIETTGQATGVGAGLGSATARTTAQLQGSLPAGFSGAVWSTGTGLYPYLGWAYSVTPVVVSGTAYSDAGSTPLAGANVAVLSNGAAVGHTSSGANGYYYLLSTASSLGSQGALAYLDNHASDGAGFSDIQSGGSYTGVNIYANAIRLSTGQSQLSATTSRLATTLGSYSDTDLSFLSTSSPMTTSGYGVYVTASGAYTLDQSLSSGGALSITSGGTLGLSGSRGLTAGGPLTIGSAMAWSDSSTLTLTATGGSGNVVLDHALTASNGALSINATGTVTSTAALSVNSFTLQNGSWSQIGSTLPTFQATSFTVNGGTFIRALAGDGSSVSPYRLTDVYGLQGMTSTSLLAKNFVLANDIDASGTATWNGGQGFAPIGGTFTGTLDGQNHVISNLTISRGSTDNVGLISTLGSGGIIRYLGLAGGTISGRNQVGGLAGSATGTLANVYSTAAISGNTNVGGLVGSLGSGGAVYDSYGTGSVSGGGTVGGLIGAMVAGSSLSTSYAAGSVSGSSSLGGLVGSNMGTITGGIWNTTVTAQGVGSGSTTGATGLTASGMTSLANFTAAGWGGIDDQGGTANAWRIYDGHTAPLLRSFLTGLSVTGGNASITYDGVTSTASASITAISPTSYDTGKFLGSLVYTANSTNAGTYSSGAGLTAGGLYSSQTGYDITTTPGTFTISQAPLTVTVDNGSKVYDGTAFSGGTSLSYSGFVGGQTAAVLGGSAVWGGAAQGAVNAGTYGLSVSGLTSGNYAITYVPGTYTITSVTPPTPPVTPPTPPVTPPTPPVTPPTPPAPPAVSSAPTVIGMSGGTLLQGAKFSTIRQEQSAHDDNQGLDRDTAPGSALQPPVPPKPMDRTLVPLTITDAYILTDNTSPPSR